MAPHMLRDYHSTGGPDRYSLRTTRHGESNVPTVHHIDTSQINGKEDFFRCMGLQMRRLQHRYKMFSDNYGTKVVNIPIGVTLRDCSVVVLGTKCKLCRKCFKCKTDLNVHMKIKHLLHLKKNTSTDTNKTHCTKYRDEICEILSDTLECGTIATGKNSGLKLHNKFRLILKIGEEIVTKISVKRKHLKMNMGTQTESDDGTKLIVDKEGYESNVPDIDPPGFRNSPCKHRDPTLYAENITNQYLGSNIVTTEATAREKNTTWGRNIASNKFTESRATSVDMICCKNCNSTQIPSITLSHLPVLNEESHDFVEPCSKSSWNSRDEIHDLRSVINDANIMSKENNENEKQRDINANETLMDISEKKLENTINQILEDSEVPQVRLESPQHLSASPLQLLSFQSHSPLPQKLSVHRRHSMPPEVAIISQPSSTSSKPSSRCRRQSAPPEQPLSFQQSSTPPQQISFPQQPSTPPQQTSTPQQTPSSQQPSTPSQQAPLSQQPSTFYQPLTLQQSSTPSQQPSLQEQTATPINDRTDDEIQEVLRIIRGHNNNNNKEINHESPNRHEQELLLRDVIEDMKKMEERGLHLLEKTVAKKRKRAPRKSNPKNSGANNESTKKRKKSAARSNTEQNVNNPTKRKRTSNTKEQTKKIQNQNNASVEDILKENLMIGNANLNSMHETLRGYGINFYNDMLEVNNNTENIQEAVNSILALSAGAMENGSNRPIVIDLVNDTTK